MIRKILIDDKDYPKNLKNIHNPPKTLYVNGTLEPGDEFSVALVGSRRASPYGIETSERLGYELASRGVTVVSGMARGIDSAAHRGALKAKGRTIAVLGSGHNNIYPPENDKLYAEIVKSGVVVSEFTDDIPPIPENFPRRNRIISGLSLGVVVVEAARNSGALITANFALEQNREVFAVPGKLSSHTSSGANALIKEGAKLVQGVEDVLEELSLKMKMPDDGRRTNHEPRTTNDDTIGRMTKAYIYNSLTADERKVYKAVSDEPANIDDIIDAAEGIKKGELSKILLNLELKKVVKRLPGGKYSTS